MKNIRPGIKISMEDHWKEYFVMNCICMLNMLPNDVAIRFKVYYKLSELAEAMFGWEPGRLTIEIEMCSTVLISQNPKLSWWLEEGEFYFDYNVSSKAGNN
jgi:hypothetical protein